MINVKFEDIIRELDLNLVAEAILKLDEGEPTLTDFDFEDAKRLVWIAGEKWLVRDLQEFTLEGTEVKKETPINFPPSTNFKAFTDLTGIVKGTIEPFKAYAGKRYIVDWKTSKNTLDTVWRQRLIDSWQWQQYAWLYGADIVLYRGISRTGGVAEIILKVPESNTQEVLELLDSTGRQIQSLYDGDFLVWPRNKPYSCHAYGRDCEFLEDCQEYTMPKAVPPRKNLSHTYIKNFTLCNEKARRMAILDKDDHSEETAFGGMVHRGLANLYEQAYKIYG